MRRAVEARCTGHGAVGAAAAVVLVLVGGACHKAAPAVVDARVNFRGDPALGGAVSGELLAARALLRFGRSNTLRVAAGATPRPSVDYTLVIDAGLGLGQGEGEAVLRSPMTARLVHVGAPAGERPIQSRAVAERGLKGGEKVDAAAARAHLERAIDDVVDALAARARARLGSTAELLALIGSGDAEVRGEAVAAAGERRESAAVPALSALLKSEDVEVRDQALGALIEIGDPRAARPITELARLDNRAEMPKIIDALAAIGGDEARSYLQFVVASHDDEELRSMAREALARLGASPAPPTTAPARP